MLMAQPTCYLCSLGWSHPSIEGRLQAGLTLVTKEQEIIKHLLFPRYFAGWLIELPDSSHKVGTTHMQGFTLRMWTPGLCDQP